MKWPFSFLILTFSLGAFSQTPLQDLKDLELKEELHKISGENYVSLTYKEARINMFNKIYLEKEIVKDEAGEKTKYYNLDAYCGTKFYRKFKNDTPNDIELPDSNVFNTEHTWPQSRFNENLNQEIQKTDLHHLYPTGNKINSQRGNFEFADVGVSTNTKPLACEGTKLGNSIGYGKGIYFEPRKAHKGNVARALFYFSVRYQIAIQPNEEIFLKFWHMLDPVDNQEKERNDMIASVQKNRNPFIDRPELVLQIADF